jgi:hypothetical protein
MKSKKLIRAVTALACLISPFTAVLGVTAQPAAADTLCHAYPESPWWANETVGELTGSSWTSCGNTYAAVRAEVKLQEWTSVGWDDLTYASDVEKNTDWAYATAYFDCAGMATWGFRSIGYATGIMDTGWNSQEGWKASTGYYYNCPKPPPVPINYT